jgi:hypothetical protein
MPDTPDIEAAESAEAAQDAVQDDAPSHPWGDDFDAERAWNTIQNLRAREKELEPVAKAFQRLESGEDIDTFKALAEKHGFEIPEDDDVSDALYDDDGDGDDDPVDPRLSKVEKWIEEQEARAAKAAFDEHLERLQTENEIELPKPLQEAIYVQSINSGFGPKATEAAFNAVKEALAERDKRVVESYLESKKAPHVSATGQSATENPDLSDEQTRQRWMIDRVFGGPVS